MQLLEAEACLMSLRPPLRCPRWAGHSSGTQKDPQHRLLPAPIGGDLHHDTLDISFQPLTF